LEIVSDGIDFNLTDPSSVSFSGVMFRDHVMMIQVDTKSETYVYKGNWDPNSKTFMGFWESAIGDDTLQESFKSWDLNNFTGDQTKVFSLKLGNKKLINLQSKLLA